MFKTIKKSAQVHPQSKQWSRDWNPVDIRVCVCVCVYAWSVMPNSCDPMDYSMPGSSVLYYLPEFAQIHAHQVSDAIQPSISSSVIPVSSCPQSFPAAGSFPKSQLFTSDGQSIGASVSASVFPMNIQDWFPGNQVWSPCSPRASQESFLAPQFKSISFLALSLLYGQTLTSTHDYWKNHSFAYRTLYRQNDVSDFLIHSLGLPYLFFQGANIF